MFEIRLDDKLKVKKIEVVFENNPPYKDQIEKLITKLSFKRTDDKQRGKARDTERNQQETTGQET